MYMNLILAANVMFRLENEERYRRLRECVLKQRNMNQRKMLKRSILLDNFNRKKNPQFLISIALLHL